eukprot:2772900-Prymnesium_polylepis.1
MGHRPLTRGERRRARVSRSSYTRLSGLSMFGLGKPPPSPPPLLSAAGDYDQTAVAYVVILYAIYALYR